jgi:hypothetical protein
MRPFALSEGELPRRSCVVLVFYEMPRYHPTVADFLDGVNSYPAYERVIVVEELGAGRLLGDDPSWRQRDGSIKLRLPVNAPPPRRDPESIGSSPVIGDHDFEVHDNGRFRMVRGLIPQCRGFGTCCTTYSGSAAQSTRATSALYGRGAGVRLPTTPAAAYVSPSGTTIASRSVSPRARVRCPRPVVSSRYVTIPGRKTSTWPSPVSISPSPASVAMTCRRGAQCHVGVMSLLMRVNWIARAGQGVTPPLNPGTSATGSMLLVPSAWA